MRPCATASAVFTGLCLAAAMFAACSGSPAPSQHLDSTPTEPVPSQTAVTAAQTAEPTATPAPEQTAKPKKKPAETVADCKAMLSEITNEPPEGGVVMNNATTSGDAGSSDRLQPLVDAIKSKRDSFRCCFDLYARKNPGAQGKVTWQLKLKPDGTVEEASILKDKSDVTAPEVESCMAELAKSMSWARSPSGKDTTLNYPFEFKRRQ